MQVRSFSIILFLLATAASIIHEFALGKFSQDYLIGVYISRALLFSLGLGLLSSLYCAHKSFNRSNILYIALIVALPFVYLKLKDLQEKAWLMTIDYHLEQMIDEYHNGDPNQFTLDQQAYLSAFDPEDGVDVRLGDKTLVSVEVSRSDGEPLPDAEHFELGVRAASPFPSMRPVSEESMELYQMREAYYPWQDFHIRDDGWLRLDPLYAPGTNLVQGY